MTGLAISIGQYSDRGRKPANQDFHGALIPEPPLAELKGIAIALADGISSSAVSAVAAETAVKSFLTDYYATSDGWPVKTAAHRVIAATNAWLHAQTRGLEVDDIDQGYVTTLSVMVLKSRMAHLFHIGDSRICRLVGRSLEQLTVDHKVPASADRAYLARALGVGRNVEVDYRAVTLTVGDVFVLTTDGVHEYLAPGHIADAITEAADLDDAARAIAERALAAGSADNLTVQLVRIDGLPEGLPTDILGQSADLPLPPPLEPGIVFEGYSLVRPLHANARSQVFLAEDTDDHTLVALKVPGSELREDRSHLARFLLEEWIARRINSPHVLRAHRQERPRRYLYTVTDYVEGQTLAQWMADNPAPDLNVVRDLVEQIAKGLRAFHRQDMLHQDLRPDNIMIDRTGTVKIIDFGSTRVAGIAEAVPAVDDGAPLGTVQYMAPEYLLGEGSTERSDQFSLGVIAYQMLSGRLPYGAEAARLRHAGDTARLRYVPIRAGAIPAWVDRALERAVHPDPERRYAALSEFTHDLRHPSTDSGAPPRRPVGQSLRFWQAMSAALATACLVLLVLLLNR